MKNLIKFLRIKLHGLRVTDTNLNYEGSITLPSEILKECKIHPGEFVYVVNLNNGERFETYVLEGDKKGEVVLNGGTARLGVKGDKLLVFAYHYITEEDVGVFKPKVYYFNEKNEIIEKKI
jgi:aspartate 1-decarboxylase